MEKAIWLVAAYLIGGIPFGFLIGKCRGVDVRTVGSKNIGATNVFRTVGKGWGFLALALDMMKGLLPTLACRFWGPEPLVSGSVSFQMPLLVGLACVFGHMLTPYMKFKGGKGVATGFGMLIALLPAMVGVAFLVFAALFAATNFISLGSCGAATFLAVAVWFPILGSPGWAGDKPLSILVALLGAFVVFKHRANIGRLLRGEENKIYLFRKKPA